MTIALPALGVPRKHKLDLSWPILVLFAALLCVLIILPMSWLFYYSLVDRNGAFTLNNFKTLVTDPVFVDPLTTTLILAAPNSGLLSKIYRAATGGPRDEHLFNIDALAGVIFVISCYTFPYVFVLI